jgi:hypothetical protein
MLRGHELKKIILFCLLISLAMGACKKSSSPSTPTALATPTAMPTPTIQTLWKNGTMGTWFGNGFGTLSVNGGTQQTVVMTDNLNGDTNALRCFAPAATWPSAGFGFFYYSANVTPSAYYPAGHLQFDIMLDQPVSFFWNLQVDIAVQTGLRFLMLIQLL